MVPLEEVRRLMEDPGTAGRVKALMRLPEAELRWFVDACDRRIRALRSQVLLLQGEISEEERALHVLAFALQAQEYFRQEGERAGAARPGPAAEVTAALVRGHSVDTRFCDHCDRDTLHSCFDAGHECDSSNDHRTCRECGWTWYGLTGKYEPPAEPDHASR